MKGFKLLVSSLVLLGCLSSAMAQPVTTQTLSVTGLTAKGNCFCTPNSDLFKRKKKYKAHILALGAVIGTPVGFGGRVIFRPTRLAVAGDLAFNRIRTDRGILMNAMVAKADARFYSKGLLGKLLRPYVFAGMTMQRGRFNETTIESVFSADAGLGAGIKIWKLELNGEVGVLLPARRVETYNPGFGAFANVGIMFWLL